MPWLKFDDAAGLEHRKTRRLLRTRGLEAFGLHMLALLHCSRYLTDGFVDEEFVEEAMEAAKVKPRDQAAITAALVKSGQWSRSDGGWTIHGYLEHNPAKAEVESRRAIDSYRKELTRDHELTQAIRNRDGDCCRYCSIEVNWNDRRSKTGGTYDHVMPISQGGGNSYDNVVVACRGCNNRKGPRTPAQAGMTLIPAKYATDHGQVPARSGSGPVPSRPVPIPNEVSSATPTEKGAEVLEHPRLRGTA